MAAKDDILTSFLNHDTIQSKYGLSKEAIPNSVREGLHSEIPIVKAISIIVDGLEKSPPMTDSELRKNVLQYLNSVL